MRYYMIERDFEEEDEPCRVYIEAHESGLLLRKIEIYRNGIHITTRDASGDSLEDLTADGQRFVMTADQFDEMWSQSREMPDGINGMFF